MSLEDTDPEDIDLEDTGPEDIDLEDTDLGDTDPEDTDSEKIDLEEGRFEFQYLAAVVVDLQEKLLHHSFDKSSNPQHLHHSLNKIGST